MNVTAEQLGIRALTVRSYLEAIGVLVAHRAGIHPTALTSNVAQIREFAPEQARPSLTF
jgi:hypothetical protein